jgi:cytochrome c oxidase subunit 4
LDGGHGPGHVTGGGEYQPLPIKTEIGTREVVGYGRNGEESYLDDYAYPFPAIRFKEDTAEIVKLREKEKGDWKKMTVEEKKQLYRQSFCSTLVEVKAPSNTWKAIVGIVLACISTAIWGMVWLTTFAYDDLPISMTDETWKRATLQRMIDQRAGPVQGLASHYDYEKNVWKSMP